MIEIETIENATKGLLHISYDADRKALIIDADLSPKIIDNNFNELDERLSKVEKALENRLSSIDDIIGMNTLLTSEI